MRWTHPQKRSAWLAAALWVPALLAPAQAQTMSTDSGTCEGMVGMQTIAGKTFVSVDQLPITGMAGYVYNRAECECKTRDLGMRIEMSMPIPMGASGVGAELWVGAADCTAATTRQQTGTLCEKASTPITLSSFMSIGTIDLTIPSETIPNPKPVNWMSTDPMVPTYPYSCDVNGTSTRTFFVLLGDLTSSPATCKLPLAIDTTPPAAPKNVSAANGDGAVTVFWEAPTGDNTQDIDSYQVLCRRKDQPTVPVKSTDFRQSVRYYYSTCINGSMYRRPPPTQTANKPAYPDKGIPEAVAGVFSLHPAFICSDRVQVGAGGTSFNARITELENGVPYEFLVVAIDKSGNPSTPSQQQILAATPAPVVNPLSQFCQTEQDCPAGFGCAMADGRRRPLAETSALAMLGLGSALIAWRSSRRRKSTPSLTGRSA